MADGHHTYAVGIDEIVSAARLISGVAHRTPVLTCSALDRMAHRHLYFKCENFQKVGAFKFRGACHAIARLPDPKAEAGVVTHSSGNHAQALALAASLKGIDAHVVMPENAPDVKRRAVRDYGGKVYACRPTLVDRERTAQQVVEETGGTLIPPFDHPDIIAGQGTVALELLDQVNELDAVIAPVGGGGLMSGVCVAMRASAPQVRLFAGEPAGADDAARSMKEGRRIPVTSTDTIADGLLTSLGHLTWPIIKGHVESVITVTDDQIVSAMRLVWERMKIIIEPSAAVSLAAVLSDAFQALPELRHVGLILSGGNVDLDRRYW